MTSYVHGEVSAPGSGRGVISGIQRYCDLYELCPHPTSDKCLLRNLCRAATFYAMVDEVHHQT